MNRFLSRTIATLSIGIPLHALIPIFGAIAQPVPLQLYNYSPEAVLPDGVESRRRSLECFLEQAQTQVESNVPVYYQLMLARELLGLAIESRHAGQPAQAKQTLDDALSLLLNRDIGWQEIITLEAIAEEYIQQGFVEDGRSLLEQSLTLARQPNVATDVLSQGVFTKAASQYRRLDEPEQSLAILAEAHQLATQEVGFLSIQPLGLIAMEYINAGEFALAETTLAQGLYLTGSDPYLRRDILEPVIRTYITVEAGDRIPALISQEPRAEQIHLLQIAAEQYGREGAVEFSLAALDQAVVIAKTMSENPTPEEHEQVLPTFHEEWLDLIEQYVTLGQPEQALQAVESTEDWYDPRTPDYLKLYITASMGRTDAVVETLESFITDYGDWQTMETIWGNTLSHIIELYADRNQIETLEHLYALAPFQTEAESLPWEHSTRLQLTLALIRTYLAEGRTSEVQTMVAEVVETLAIAEQFSKPTDESVIRDLFVWHLKYGEYDAAMQLLYQFPQLDGDYWQPRLSCLMEPSAER